MYKLNGTESVIRLSDGASIPFANGNRDYEEYKQWLVDGNTPEPEDVYVAPKPTVVTMRQARLALLQGGLLATVDTAIATGTDEAMKIEWEYATEVRRDWGSLITLTAMLGMTETQLDDLFLLASTL